MSARILALGALALTLLLGAAARNGVAAQDWPNRPITMVIPLDVGSGLDILGRALTPRLSEILGQPVVVENIGGAGGMAGAARVARATPDGYQFLLGTVGTHAQNQTLYKNPQYNATTDFTSVALIAEQPLVLISRKNLPADNLQEFITYAKINQAKMQYGSAGLGSAAHLACMLLNAAIGINVTHVPYRGGAGAMQDLMAGLIDYQCPASTIAAPQIDGRLVKAIATLTKSRSPNLPDVPTAQEQGLTGFDAGIWYALFLPKNAPPAIVNKLHDAVDATLNTPAVQHHLNEIGATVVAPERRSPEYLAKFVASEIEKWAGPIKVSGVQID